MKEKLTDAEFEDAFVRLKELFTIGRNRRLSEVERYELRRLSAQVGQELIRNNND